MRKRHAYVLLFGVPGLFIALILALLVCASASGFLWLYRFGDQPWPATTGLLLTSLLAGTFLILWAASLAGGYLVGKRLETRPGLNRRHLLMSAALTVAPVLLLVLHQWSIGNLGPRPDSLVCRDLCLEKGFPASGMPPQESGDRSCLCFEAGQEVLRLPLDGSTAGR